MYLEFSRVGLDPAGRVLLSINILLSLLYIIIPLYYFLERGVYTILTLALMGSGNIIISLVTLYRYTLISRHPYLINLPSFMIALSSPRLTPQRRGFYINRVFKIILAAGLLIGLYLLPILYYTLQDLIYASPPDPFPIIIYSISAPIPILLYVIYSMKRVYTQLSKEAI